MDEQPTRTATAQRRGSQWIVVQVADTAYLIRSAQIAQVEMAERITPVPNAPPFVRGVAFLRGEVVPVIDLRVRLGLPAVEVGVATRTVVVETEGRRIGLLVDRAREVVYALDEEVVPPPDSAGGASHIVGVIPRDDRLLLVLDVEKIIAAAPDARPEGQPPAAPATPGTD